MYLKTVFIFILLFLSSCASVQSGRYVQITQDRDINFIAKHYNLSVDYIREANGDAAFKPGAWIFIPERVGIFGADPGLLGRGPSNYVAPFSSGKFLWPVPAVSKISSPFGKRWGRHHDGIDIPAKIGTRIVAVDDAVVIYSGKGLSGYGNLIVLGHKNGFFSVYAHNSVNLVQKGQRIRRGEMIGKVGNTGRSTGPHLHFELRNQSKPLDPERYLARKK